MWAEDARKRHSEAERFNHPLLDDFGFEGRLLEHSAQAIQNFAERHCVSVLKKIIYDLPQFPDAQAVIAAIQMAIIVNDPMTQKEADSAYEQRRVWEDPAP